MSQARSQAATVACGQADERGIALVYLAIVGAALIALIALAIDVSILFSTNDKYSRAADRAALAALEAYLGYLEDNPVPDPQNPGNAYDLALGSAVLRAREISGLNLENTLAVKYRKNKENLSSSLGSSGFASDEIGKAGEDEPDGDVIPGIWHFVDPDPNVLNSNICDTSPNIYTPCFERVNNISQANAIRVLLKTREESPVINMFRGLISEDNPQIGASATAALIPRRAVIAFDLSRSVIRDTHLGQDLGPIRKSEYAHYVDPNKAGGANCAAWENRLIEVPDQEAYDNLSPTRVSVTDDRIHFKEDFSQCFTIPITRYDADSGTTTTSSESFAIDQVTNPEPLTGILSGINTMLTVFESRGVTGDRVGVLGFDDGLLDQRRLPKPERNVSPPDTPQFLIQPTSGEPEFAAFMDATDQTKPFVDRKDSFLFPRYFGDRFTFSGRRRSAMTDPRMALREALDMLKKEPGFEVADNFVLLISDGLGNCVAPDEVSGTYENAPIPGLDCFNSSDPLDWPVNEQYITQAFSDVYRFGPGGELEGLARELRDDRIKLHIALIGDGVSPHTVVKKGNSGCLNSGQAQQSGISLVNANNTNGYSPASGEPFFFPNNYYNVAAATGGIWAPVLDCCRDSASGECWNSNTSTDPSPLSTLEDACNNASGLSFGSAVPCTCDRTDPACLVAEPHCRYIDDQSRLRCDPSGRNKSEGLQKLVQDIMNKNPFILVD